MALWQGSTGVCATWSPPSFMDFTMRTRVRRAPLEQHPGPRAHHDPSHERKGTKQRRGCFTVAHGADLPRENVVSGSLRGRPPAILLRLARPHYNGETHEPRALAFSENSWPTFLRLEIAIMATRMMHGSSCGSRSHYIPTACSVTNCGRATAWTTPLSSYSLLRSSRCIGHHRKQWSDT